MSSDIKVFFGKFSTSNSQFKKQIDEKRYYSKKGSSWFGDIKEGDYCYILAGNEVYLWKAKKYEDEYLQFEIVIENKLPIDSNKFKAFKYFIFNPQIIVLATRQVRNKAFFKIDFIDSFTEEILNNIETYKNENNFRNIIITDNNSEKNDKDIYLIKDKNFKYTLFPSNFIDKKTIETFVDNSDKLGKSGKKTSRKDNTIERIKSTELNHVVKDVSILSFYDLFFNQYKVEAIDESEEEIEIDEEGNPKMPTDTKQTQPLNQILYGSPGTGKTYNTINKALEIIFEKENREKEFEFKIKDKKGNEKEPINKTYTKILEITDENEKRQHLKGLFEYFKEEQRGQIEFVTFHQSYGYEEFVEGINAKTNEETKQIEYEIEAGIFKKLCEKAKTIKAQTNKLDFDWNRGNIFKMSLGGKSDSEILDWCLDNEYISMGWGNEIDFSSITAQNWEDFRDKAKSLYENLDTDRFTLQAMFAFKEWMKKDDLVFISLGNLKIVAVGQVISDYEYKDNIDEIRYSQFRKVKWLFIDKSGIPVEKLLNKKLSQQTIYNLDKSYVKKDFLDSLFIGNDKEQLANYILIIDEINRGNISKIFGELITLIETSKRIGADEEIKVKLPYSGDDFGVPKNLYIIGTMNTSDRSIAPIDTALRRRFVFEEMAPNSSLLSENIENVNLQSLLEAINTRIEYLYDRDHTIGHAYLIDVKTLDDLKFAFKNKIIPLLAEYFYEDWENIDLVLNQNGFIIPNNENKFYLSKKIEEKIRNKITYKVSEKDWEVENFQKIYDDKVNLTKKIEDYKTDIVDLNEQTEQSNN